MNKSRLIKYAAAICAALIFLSSCSFRNADDAPESETMQNVPRTNSPTDSIPDVGSAQIPYPEDTSTPYDKNAHLGSKLILIDAGHGFGDPGCTSEYMNGRHEKQVTYEMALLLKSALEKKGYEAVLLRGTDSFPSGDEIIKFADMFKMNIKKEKINNDNVFQAYERTIYANILHRETPFALMLSLHVNSIEGHSGIRGTEIYYCEDNDLTKRSENLAELIEDEIREKWSDLRIKTEGLDWDNSYIVTKFTETPSVLVEMGYATNEDDAKLLFDEGWRNDYVNALTGAVDEYIKSRD